MNRREHAKVHCAALPVFNFGLLTGLLLSAAACVSPSGASDVSRVRELTRSPALPHVVDTDVELQSTEEVAKLLRKPIDADSAVRIALLGNRELRAQLREMGIARGRLMQAGVLPNPVFELEILPERNSAFEFRVEYDLTSALLAPLRERAAAPDLQAARLQAAGAVVELGYRVRTAYYQLQASTQRLAIAQRMLDAAAAAHDATLSMHAAGNLADLELATQDATLERARVQTAQLELEAVLAREPLTRLLGGQGATQLWQVAGELAPAPEQADLPADIELRTLRASLELAERRQRLEGLARRTGTSRAQGWIPDVTIDVHALQGTPESAGGPGADDKLRFGGGVQVGVPMFDRKQGVTTALEAEFDAGLERYSGMAADLRSAAREARSRVVSAHARARHYQLKIVPAQLRVSAQTLLQYNAMQIGIFQLLQARQSELEVQLAQVETLREYWSAVAALNALLSGKHVGGAALPSGIEMRTAPSSAGGH